MHCHTTSAIDHTLISGLVSAKVDKMNLKDKVFSAQIPYATQKKLVFKNQ